MKAMTYIVKERMLGLNIVTFLFPLILMQMSPFTPDAPKDCFMRDSFTTFTPILFTVSKVSS